MKYRSPSSNNALSTPPRSLTDLQVFRSAINLFDSLESFYQQKRYRVHHTRAALELAVTKGIDAPSPSASSSSLAPRRALPSVLGLVRRHGRRPPPS